VKPLAVKKTHENNRELILRLQVVSRSI